MPAWVRFLPSPRPEGRLYVTCSGSEISGEAGCGEERQFVIGGELGTAFAETLQRHPEGFVCVEWDIAYDLFDAVNLEAALEPGGGQEPVCALYPIFEDATWRDSFGYRGAATGAVVSIGQVLAASGYRRPEPGDTHLDGFSFGLTYLPGAILALARDDGLLAQLRFPDADVLWSGWCTQRGIRARIAWDSRPKHLHF